jgi:hypothetical protein
MFRLSTSIFVSLTAVFLTGCGGGDASDAPRPGFSGGGSGGSSGGSGGSSASASGGASAGGFGGSLGGSSGYPSYGGSDTGGEGGSGGSGAIGGSAGAAGLAGSAGSAGDGGGGSGGSENAGGSGGAGGGSGQSCPPGQLATGVGSGGLICKTVDSAVRAAFNANCSAYLGWSDSDNCSGCALTPAKWGRTSDTSCSNGTGANGTCQTSYLGGQSVRTIGINPDGDVDSNDTIYFGFRCPAPGVSTKPGPCATGEFAVSVSESSVECMSIADVMADYVGKSCQLYSGWLDYCNGCTLAPTKWGRVGHSSCTNGAGTENTCTTPTLGGSTVNLFGLNFDGDVDGNDKLYVGLSCATAITSSGNATGKCPAGRFVKGLNPDGTLACADAKAEIAAAVRGSCSAYWGVRDNCHNCTTLPEKWGRSNGTGCLNGTGSDNTCSTASLGGSTVQVFGLNPDGDVDDNDKLYLGLKCF